MSGNLTVFNPTKDDDWYTQRNNPTEPDEACGPTRQIMCILQAGHQLPPTNDPADEALMKLCRSEKYLSIMRNDPANYGWCFEDEGKRILYYPNEIPALLCQATNEFMGKELCEFGFNWDVRDLIFKLLKGWGVGLSGKFQTARGNIISHQVSLAGFASYQEGILEIQSAQEVDLDQIQEFYLDDPYGNPNTLYADFNGNNVPIEADRFNKIFKEQGFWLKKWAHVIHPAREFEKSVLEVDPTA